METEMNEKIDTQSMLDKCMPKPINAEEKLKMMLRQ